MTADTTEDGWHDQVAGECLRELMTQRPTPETDKLAVARGALMQIEERYVDGCDTYEDWKFMGDTAREALARIDEKGGDGA